MVNGIIITQDLNTFIAQIKDMIEEQFNKRFSSSDLTEQNEELTTDEVARLLKTTRQTVNNWAKQGILTKYKRGGNTIYLKKEVLSSAKEIKKNTKKKKA